MQNINIYLTVVFLLFISNNLTSQDFELVKIQSTLYPKQSIEESTVDGEISFFEWSAQVGIPQRFKKTNKTLLIHRLGYSNLRVDTEANMNATFLETTKHYHTISYNLGLVKIFNPRWRLLVNANPLLASDFAESITGDDLLFQGSALALYAKNINVTYGFGAVYTNRFGRPLVIPMGIFKYKTRKMILDVILPNKFSLMFNTPNRTFFYGIKAELDGGLFNNTSDLNVINAIIDEAGYSRINVGPEVAVKVNSTFKINITGGFAVGRRMEFIDLNENTFDRTPESGPFFNIGVTFILSKETETKLEDKN